MRSLLATPIEDFVSRWWRAVDASVKWSFAVAAIVSVLAFGFEMTNLTLHHDDLNHLMVQKPLVGYYLGRFVHAWLFFHGQQGHYRPFLDMTAGILLMAAYGVLVARFWGARRTLDTALVAAVLCVFPYMAHIYQYNSAMIAYPLAHLLVAAAVALSTRARGAAVLLAAVLYFVAFSIYQAVLASAATIFLFWIIAGIVFRNASGAHRSAVTVRAAVAALAAVILGGLLHVIAVQAMNIPFDSAQGADEAFSLQHRLEHGLRLAQAVAQVVAGTRSFLFWPENYFPGALKKLQLALLAGAGVMCLWLPRGPIAKAAAVGALALAVLAPRTLQLLHAKGNFHSLTLTGYAVLVAGAVMILLRTGSHLARNATALAAVALVLGYTMTCAWISTVNHLNTLAHYTTLTQILTRLRTLPAGNWDGRTVAVVGSYDMRSDFPFRPGTGVASEFLGVRHMNQLARVMRDEAVFLTPDRTLPGVLEYGATHAPWPSPESVAIVDGVGVVVLSRRAAQTAMPQ